MKRLTLLQLGFLLALAPACDDDVTPTGDTEQDSEGSTGDESETMTTVTTTGVTTTGTNPTTSGTTTGDTDPTVGDTTGDTDPTGDTETTTGDTETTTGDTTGDTEGTTGPGVVCGDDEIGGDEECDGADLGDAACPFFGDVACADDCTLDLSACDDTLVMCNMPASAIDGTTTAAAPALDVMSIVADAFVTDVNVQVQATHTFAADILAELISPDPLEGSLLMDGTLCGGADDVDATFDDENGVVPACGVPAFDGPISPVSPLNRLIGINSVGDWTLSTWDDGAGDFGTLDQWCLELTLSADDPVMCGDGTAHYGEVCDTDDFKGSTCGSAGDFVGGEISCADDCTLDTTACLAPGCGNGILEDGEDCDGDELDGTVCGDIDGFSGGDLACAADCTFDTTACGVPGCGNGILEDGEDCDADDFGGAICDDIEGFLGGDIACAVDCTFDTATCDVAPVGDTCGNAIIIDETALPYTNSDDTLNFSNDYGYATGACPGETDGFNSGAEDVVYQITPDTTGTYTIEFDATWDSTVYAVTDCADIDNTCVAGSDNGNPETLVTELIAGTTYFIVGGHWSNTTPGSGGAYTLSVSETCNPVCDGISCDIDDGCGGTCGCEDGEVCGDGTCAPVVGETCGDPIIVGALPYSDSGDTDDFADDYGYSAGACPGEESGWNGGAPDVVYAFTPVSDGDYEIVFDTSWDSTVYMVTDCADVDGTCVAGEDNGNPETITTTLTGGETYFVIGGPWGSFGSGGAYTLNITDVTP